MLLLVPSEPVVKGEQGAEDVVLSLVLLARFVVIGFVVPEIVEDGSQSLPNTSGYRCRRRGELLDVES